MSQRPPSFTRLACHSLTPNQKCRPHVECRPHVISHVPYVPLSRYNNSITCLSLSPPRWVAIPYLAYFFLRTADNIVSAPIHSRSAAPEMRRWRQRLGVPVQELSDLLQCSFSPWFDPHVSMLVYQAPKHTGSQCLPGMFGQDYLAGQFVFRPLGPNWYLLQRP